MDRRSFVLATLTGLVAAPVAPVAQQRTKLWKIGYLAISRPRPGQQPRGLNAFFQRLRELGYAEGQNLVFEQRYSDGDIERFPALAGELIRLGVDLLVVLGTPAAQAAQRHAPTLPIVMVGGRNPVEGGLARSLARPGGTVTGLIQDVGHDVSIKSFELLKEAVPHSARIAVLTSSQPENIEAARLIAMSANRFGVTIEPVIVSGRSDIETAFTAMSRNRIDAMQALPVTRSSSTATWLSSSRRGTAFRQCIGSTRSSTLAA
jgi:putative ABC transport system substrate-binding protein